MKWNIIDQFDSKDGSKLTVTVRDEDGWYECYMKWDGCCQYYVYSNVPAGEPNAEEPDTIHICDLDQEIAGLQSLREFARQHFGPDWSR